MEEISLETLRRRRSAKWRMYPPEVLPVFVAEMDFRLAPPVRAALLESIELDDTGYAYPVEVPAAFAAFARERLAWEVDPARIGTLPDVMAGLAEVLRAVTEPGAGVVLSPPVYPPFFHRLRAIGRTVVEAPLAHADDGSYELDLDALERAFAAGASAYILCNPHNPVGRVFARPTLERVAELARTYGVTVIADEIHAPLVLPGATFVPWTTVVEDGIALLSASKAFNLPGLKSALIVCPPELYERLDPDVTQWGSGHFGAVATLAALREGGPWLDELLVQLDANRQLLARLLAEQLPEIGYVPPEATYLAWLDCRALGLGDDPAATFLERGRVALYSGPEFGAAGRGFARFNLATSPELITEAVRRMATAV